MTSVILSNSVEALGPVPGAGLLFALLLAAAIIGGYVARACRIPRVVGYLIAGAALKLLLYWYLRIEENSVSAGIMQNAAETLKPIKDLGLGLILFAIGGVFETRHLKSVGKKILKLSICESGLTFLLVFIGTALVGLFTGTEATIEVVIAFALLLGFAAIATAPAATLFVLREYDAKGPTTDTILSLTGVNNITCLITFHTCFLLLVAGGLLQNATLSSSGVWLDLGLSTLGSIALGIVIGFVLSIMHAKLHLSETTLILVVVFMILGTAEGWLLKRHNLSYDFLLIALCTGATFANLAIDPERFLESLKTIGQPILVGFFVIAGYNLHLAHLVHIGWLGAAYIICRVAGKIIGLRLGMAWSKTPNELQPYLGSALLCQAAVVIGLSDFVTAYWQHPWARDFATVVLGSVVVFEVCGPLLTKWAVKRAGEVKAITLLRGPRPANSASTLALTWAAFLRTVGLQSSPRIAAKGPILVRHVMRPNIKCVPQDADFDDVLHFVEQSRFNHFPVVDDHHQLVGVIHFSDIREILYNPYLSHLMTAQDLTSPTIRTVHAEMPMEEALRTFQDGDVGSMPVVESEDSRAVVGIIEQRDLLRAFHVHRDS